MEPTVGSVGSGSINIQLAKYEHFVDSRKSKLLGRPGNQARDFLLFPTPNFWNIHTIHLTLASSRVVPH